MGSKSHSLQFFTCVIERYKKEKTKQGKIILKVGKLGRMRKSEGGTNIKDIWKWEAKIYTK